ncbi:unnamed protein product [Alopecurus aequalis]
MLDRRASTLYYVEDGSVHKDLESKNKKKEDTTVVEVRTSSGLSGYFSFKLAPPPHVSYLNLHWPKGPGESSWFPAHPAYSSVLAADKNLLLIRVAIPGLPCYHDVPHDLFVYTADGSRPSLEKLELPTVRPQKLIGDFFVLRSGIGILRIAGNQGHYIVADLHVGKPGGSGDYVAEICLFFSASKSRKPWDVHTINVQQSVGGQFPVRWLTSTVLPFDGRFLCWADYFSGVLLLSDFCRAKAPVLSFLPFPGKQYSDKVRMGIGRRCPDRFRSMSISQGMMCFVDIDNNFHEILHMDDKDTAQPLKKSGPKKITIWTLDIGTFTWKKHRQIRLRDLWASYEDEALAIPKRLPEFPVINMDDPDLVWCLVREKEFAGKAWKIVVDMKNAKLASWTPYVNDQPYHGVNMALKDSFANVPLLPVVIPNYLNSSQ